jgi:hypothetical protein
MAVLRKKRWNRAGVRQAVFFNLVFVNKGGFKTRPYQNLCPTERPKSTKHALSCHLR